jgi:hypothetical protein
VAQQTSQRAGHPRSAQSSYEFRAYVPAAARSRRPARGRRALSACAVMLPAAVLLVLGGVFLGRASMWTDEAATWISSIQPVWRIADNSAHIDAMFLPYYLFMHFWLAVSQSLWWMRLPSLIAGAATVQALVLLARRWLPVAWSVLAGFLLALNPLFAMWSMQARPYTAMALFAVVSTAALVAAIRRGRGWVGYGLAALGMMYLQLISVFMLAPQLAGLAAAGRRSAWRGVIGTLACVAVAVSPLALLTAGETGQISWIPRPTIGTFGQALLDLSGGPAEAVELVICGIVVAVLAACAAAGSETRFGSTLILAWGIGPPLLLLRASFLHPLYVDRYALVCVPGIALIEAMAIRHAWAATSTLRPGRETPGRETPGRETPGRETPGWEAPSPVTPRTTGVPGFVRRRWASALAVITCVGACFVSPALLINTGQVLRETYLYDNYRSAAAALSADLSQHPAPVAFIPDWAAIGFSYYLTPSALARLLVRQDSAALDRHVLDWDAATSGSGIVESPQRISVVTWPTGTVPINAAPGNLSGCAVGWAVGRGAPPSSTFAVGGSSCLLTQIQYFGMVWVASAEPITAVTVPYRVTVPGTRRAVG